MKKIPTLFTRIFENKRIVGITPEITPGCEEAFLTGAATIKIDGSCCAIIDGKYYKRYDAKKGKKPPVGAIPCCDPDPVTGHHPHWVQVDLENSDDKWFVAALNHTWDLNEGNFENGTYEAIGKHFNGNPYNLDFDKLVRHGSSEILVKRDFDSIKEYLETNPVEGLVFWLNGEPVCKIKKTDFGFKWPMKGE